MVAAAVTWAFLRARIYQQGAIPAIRGPGVCVLVCLSKCCKFSSLHRRASAPVVRGVISYVEERMAVSTCREGTGFWSGSPGGVPDPSGSVGELSYPANASAPQPRNLKYLIRILFGSDRPGLESQCWQFFATRSQACVT